MRHGDVVCVDNINYFIVDYKSMRFAIPATRIAELGINPKGKTDEAIITELTTFLTTPPKTEKKDEKSHPFAVVQQYYADKVMALSKAGLSLKEPFRFCFFVHPTDKGFCVRGAKDKLGEFPLDDTYPESLQVTLPWFKYGYNKSASERSARRQISSIHELTHIVHGAYFNFHDFGQIGEGFAELMPYYLMDMEKDDEKRYTAILNLEKTDLLPLDFVNRCGMFSLEEEDSSQDLRTYQSMYLWMLGYIKRVEKKYGCDKLKAAQMTLKRFERISKIDDGDTRMKWIAGFVDIPVEELTAGRTLQLEGQDYIKEQPYAKDFQKPEKEPQDDTLYRQKLTEGIQSSNCLDELDNIGKLFQKMTAVYLGVNQKQNAKLNKEEAEMLKQIKRFQQRYYLTPTETIASIHCGLNKAIWNKEYQPLERSVSRLLDISENAVRQLQHTPQQMGSNTKQQPQQATHTR